jgi:hypothetical protein
VLVQAASSGAAAAPSLGKVTSEDVSGAGVGETATAGEGPCMDVSESGVRPDGDEADQHGARSKRHGDTWRDPPSAESMRAPTPDADEARPCMRADGGVAGSASSDPGLVVPELELASAPGLAQGSCCRAGSSAPADLVTCTGDTGKIGWEAKSVHTACESGKPTSILGLLASVHPIGSNGGVARILARSSGGVDEGFSTEYGKQSSSKTTSREI